MSDAGYLEIILGPMFSGKTTQLIQHYKKNNYIGKTVCVINYSEDTRYHDSMLSTHDKIMIPCIFSSKLGEVDNDLLQKADVIIINEGQFFEDLFEFVLEKVETNHKSVYVCGLDGDFKRSRFGKILDLIPYCNKVTKLNSLCSICRDGTPGIFSHRITKETSQVVIGSDNYQPLCRQCYTAQNKGE
jgi:thymidine kinase